VSQLRFVKMDELTLEIDDRLPGRGDFPDLRQTDLAVGANLLRLVEIRCGRESKPNDVARRQGYPGFRRCLVRKNLLRLRLSGLAARAHDEGQDYGREGLPPC